MAIEVCGHRLGEVLHTALGFMIIEISGHNLTSLQRGGPLSFSSGHHTRKPILPPHKHLSPQWLYKLPAHQANRERVLRILKVTSISRPPSFDRPFHFFSSIPPTLATCKPPSSTPTDNITVINPSKLYRKTCVI